MQITIGKIRLKFRFHLGVQLSVYRVRYHVYAKPIDKPTIKRFLLVGPKGGVGKATFARGFLQTLPKTVDEDILFVLHASGPDFFWKPTILKKSYGKVYVWLWFCIGIPITQKDYNLLNSVQ